MTKPAAASAARLSRERRSSPAAHAPAFPGDVTPESLREGVRRQRRHIESLTGEDPLRGGVAD